MTEPPRRKRFQIHLSTAIVMMFAAGGIIWANLIPRRVAYIGNTVKRMDNRGKIPIFVEMELDVFVDFEFGWYKKNYIETRRLPSRKWHKDDMETGGRDDGLRLVTDDEREALRDFPSTDEEREVLNASIDFSGNIIWPNLLSNLMLFTIALSIVWFLCEWLIRRRAARKES